MVTVVLISDTHNRHQKVKVPDGDILIHAGDFSLQGKVQENTAFFKWFSELPHPHKIFISGNHDWMGERNPFAFKVLREEYPNITYLEDSGVEVMGLKIYGSPWQPEFCGWAYNLRRGQALKEKWAMIPEDTDILVTHGPPHKILDYVSWDKLHVGCEDLRERINQLPNLKVHVFGHIHSWGGKTMHDGPNPIYVNASVVDEDYIVTSNPVTVLCIDDAGQVTKLG